MMTETRPDGGQPLPPPLQKQDPETLVLRGRPRPVIRFRKGVIVGATAGVCTAIIAVTWIALEPHSLRFAGVGDPAVSLSRSAPEALAGAPSGYGEVPQLGPPLPGDLGRPILDEQRRSAAAEGAGTAAGDEASERAAAERQRRLAEEQAARSSALTVQLSGANARIQAGALPPADKDAPPAAGTRDQDAPLSARSGSILAAGAVIPASLLTGLNSDLPGVVLAQVTENVRDSATGRTVLIPQGARLIGKYDSAVAFGQQRAMLVWQRIVFPNGVSLSLDDMPATDAGGYAGLRDHVDAHGWQLLKGVALATLLGVGSQLSLGGEGGVARAIRESTQQNGAQAGAQLVGRYLDVRPTLVVRPGWPVRVLVNKDLLLEPWRE